VASHAPTQTIACGLAANNLRTASQNGCEFAIGRDRTALTTKRAVNKAGGADPILIHDPAD
jgi:hypothetical protein